MPYEKAPSSGAFLPASLMYFLSGEPMHYLSGVDSPDSVAATSQLVGLFITPIFPTLLSKTAGENQSAFEVLNMALSCNRLAQLQRSLRSP
jgi:hypothetical protein